MASIAIMGFSAVVNAASFIGGNYLAKYLSGDNGKAALDEKIRHDKALEQYQAAYSKYQKDRTALLDWIATKDRMKYQAAQDFKTTDQALAWYNRYHQTQPDKQIKMLKEPQFSDFYKPSPKQQTGELVFIGGSLLAGGYLIYRFV